MKNTEMELQAINLWGTQEHLLTGENNLYVNVDLEKNEIEVENILDADGEIETLDLTIANIKKVEKEYRLKYMIKNYKNISDSIDLAEELLEK